MSHADGDAAQPLANVDPALIAAATKAEVISLPDCSSSDLHFSPDACQFAVIPMLRKPTVIEVYNLPDGARVAEFEVEGLDSPWTNRKLAHVGDAVVHLEYSEEVGTGRRWRVVRHRLPHGGREVLLDAIAGHAVQIGAVPGGFVIVSRDRIWFGDSTGPLREQAIPALENLSLLATEPSTGHLAMALDWTKELVLLDPQLKVLARTELAHTDGYHAWFCGPDTLITFGVFHSLRSRRVVDGAFVIEGPIYVPKDRTQEGLFSLPLGVTVLPSRGAIAWALPGEAPLWYDARTLRGVNDSGTMFGDRFPGWISPGETYAIVVENYALKVYDLRLLELARLIALPLEDVTLADLDRLTDQLTLPAEARTVAERLRAALPV